MHMQANPDVQTLRNRALTCFDNLCYIYGYTQADGRYSRSSHDVDLDDDVQVVHNGKFYVWLRTKNHWFHLKIQCIIKC